VELGDNRFVKEFKVWSIIIFVHSILNLFFILNPPFLTNPSMDEDFDNVEHVLLGEQGQ